MKWVGRTATVLMTLVICSGIEATSWEEKFSVQRRQSDWIPINPEQVQQGSANIASVQSPHRHNSGRNIFPSESTDNFPQTFQRPSPSYDGQELPQGDNFYQPPVIQPQRFLNSPPPFPSSHGQVVPQIPPHILNSQFFSGGNQFFNPFYHGQPILNPNIMAKPVNFIQPPFIPEGVGLDQQRFVEDGGQFPVKTTAPEQIDHQAPNPAGDTAPQHVKEATPQPVNQAYFNFHNYNNKTSLTKPGEPNKEEVQILYVPVETLKQRGRLSQATKQKTPNFEQDFQRTPQNYLNEPQKEAKPQTPSSGSKKFRHPIQPLKEQYQVPRAQLVHSQRHAQQSTKEPTTEQATSTTPPSLTNPPLRQGNQQFHYEYTNKNFKRPDDQQFLPSTTDVYNAIQHSKPTDERRIHGTYFDNIEEGDSIGDYGQALQRHTTAKNLDPSLNQRYSKQSFEEIGQPTLPPPNQPPLSVYMETQENVRIGDVLTLLKDAKTIPVLDTIGPQAPQVFVGPSNLKAPHGYVKFELPYLSSLEGQNNAGLLNQLPFFVAPLNFQPPPGYSKIPFPPPHIGSVVVSNQSLVPQEGHATRYTPNPLNHKTASYRDPYTIPADISSISPQLPSLINSLQEDKYSVPSTTESYTPETTTEVTTTYKRPTSPRRQHYRGSQRGYSSGSYTTTPSSPTRRPSTRQRRPFHNRNYSHREEPAETTTTTTTTTTEAPEYATYEPITERQRLPSRNKQTQPAKIDEEHRQHHEYSQYDSFGNAPTLGNTGVYISNQDDSRSQLSDGNINEPSQPISRFPIGSSSNDEKSYTRNPPSTVNNYEDSQTGALYSHQNIRPQEENVNVPLRTQNVYYDQSYVRNPSPQGSPHETALRTESHPSIDNEYYKNENPRLRIQTNKDKINDYQERLPDTSKPSFGPPLSLANHFGITPQSQLNHLSTQTPISVQPTYQNQYPEDSRYETPQYTPKESTDKNPPNLNTNHVYSTTEESEPVVNLAQGVPSTVNDYYPKVTDPEIQTTISTVSDERAQGQRGNNNRLTRYRVRGRQPDTRKAEASETTDRYPSESDYNTQEFTRYEPTTTTTSRPATRVRGRFRGRTSAVSRYRTTTEAPNYPVIPADSQQSERVSSNSYSTHDTPQRIPAVRNQNHNTYHTHNHRNEDAELDQPNLPEGTPEPVTTERTTTRRVSNFRSIARRPVRPQSTSSAYPSAVTTTPSPGAKYLIKTRRPNTVQTRLHTGRSRIRRPTTTTTTTTEEPSHSYPETINENVSVYNSPEAENTNPSYAPTGNTRKTTQNLQNQPLKPYARQPEYAYSNPTDTDDYPSYVPEKPAPVTRSRDEYQEQEAPEPPQPKLVSQGRTHSKQRGESHHSTRRPVSTYSEIEYTKEAPATQSRNENNKYQETSAKEADDFWNQAVTIQQSKSYVYMPETSVLSAQNAEKALQSFEQGSQPNFDYEDYFHDNDKYQTSDQSPFASNNQHITFTNAKPSLETGKANQYAIEEPLEDPANDDKNSKTPYKENGLVVDTEANLQTATEEPAEVTTSSGEPSTSEGVVLDSETTSTHSQTTHPPEPTTPKKTGRRRGVWVRVRVKKPKDVFETAESQRFGAYSRNSLDKNVDPKTQNESKNSKQTVEKVSPSESSQRVQDPSITDVTTESTTYQENDKKETEQDQTTTFGITPEGTTLLPGEITGDTQEPTEMPTTYAIPTTTEAITTLSDDSTNSTGEPQTTVVVSSTDSPKVLGTSTTTEISLETEICYKGRCVKTKRTRGKPESDLMSVE